MKVPVIMCSESVKNRREVQVPGLMNSRARSFLEIECSLAAKFPSEGLEETKLN